MCCPCKETLCTQQTQRGAGAFQELRQERETTDYIFHGLITSYKFFLSCLYKNPSMLNSCAAGHRLQALLSNAFKFHTYQKTFWFLTPALLGAHLQRFQPPKPIQVGGKVYLSLLFINWVQELTHPSLPMSCTEGDRAVAAPSPTALSAQQATVRVGNETLPPHGNSAWPCLYWEDNSNSPDRI